MKENYLKSWEFIKEFCLNSENLSLNKKRKLDNAISEIERWIEEYDK